MRFSKAEILDALELERDVLTRGGYDASVREPRSQPRFLRDSVTCLNHAFAEKRHPCGECLLMRWVPEERRGEEIPCHHIPLDDQGRTLASLEGSPKESTETVLLGWIDRTLEREAAERG